ncbi:hypothetical protein D3C84_1016880 [compost metagenome]
MVIALKVVVPEHTIQARALHQAWRYCQLDGLAVIDAGEDGVLLAHSIVRLSRQGPEQAPTQGQQQ